MKKLIIIPLFLLAIFVNAQFKVGIGGGINFSSISGLDFSNESTTLITSTATGFNLGLITELSLLEKLVLEMDLLYSGKGYDAKIIYDDTPYPFYYKERLKYIDLPILLKYKILKVTNLHAGIQYSILVADREGNVVANFNDFAGVLGFGVDIKRLHFSTRYNIGLTKINKNSPRSSLKNNMLTLSIGIWLKK